MSDYPFAEPVHDLSIDVLHEQYSVQSRITPQLMLPEAKLESMMARQLWIFTIFGLGSSC